MEHPRNDETLELWKRPCRRDRYLRASYDQLRRHLLPVVVEQVPVNFPDEDPPVLVPGPSGNRHEINSGHDTEGAEQVPQIMKSDIRQFGVFADHSQGIPQGSRCNVFVAPLRAREQPRAIRGAAGLHFEHEGFQLRVEVQDAGTHVLGIPASANRHGRCLEIFPGSDEQAAVCLVERHREVGLEPI